jgi:hypothetical protein
MREPAAFVRIIVLSVVATAVARWQRGQLALLGVRRVPSIRRCPSSNADYLRPALSSLRQASLVLAAIVAAVAVSVQGGLRPPPVEASTTSPLVLGVLLDAPNRGVATNTGTIWSKTIFPSEYGCCNLLLPRPITDKKWFLMGFYYQLDFNSSVVLWTPNAGSNWYTYTNPAPNQHWQDFAADASGRLWGLTLDTSSPNYWGDAKIWRSDNGGVTWSQSDHEIGTSSDPIMLYRLATNPIDPNQVDRLWKT